MELKPLSPEFDELRTIIISSSLTNCFMMLEELTSAKGDRLFFDKFRTQWIEVYKNLYKQVSKMKKRSSRE